MDVSLLLSSSNASYLLLKGSIPLLIIMLIAIFFASNLPRQLLSIELAEDDRSHEEDPISLQQQH